MEYKTLVENSKKEIADDLFKRLFAEAMNNSPRNIYEKREDVSGVDEHVSQAHYFYTEPNINIHYTIESYKEISGFSSGFSIEYFKNSPYLGFEDLNITTKRVVDLLMFLMGHLYDKGLINEARLLSPIIDDITAHNILLKFLAEDYLDRLDEIIDKEHEEWKASGGTPIAEEDLPF